MVHAGRIRQFIQNWQLITQDQWVLHPSWGLGIIETKPPGSRETRLTAPLQLSSSISFVISVIFSADKCTSGGVTDCTGIYVRGSQYPWTTSGVSHCNKPESTEQVYQRGALQDGKLW